MSFIPVAPVEPQPGQVLNPSKGFWYFLSLSQGRQPEQQWLLRCDVGFALHTPGQAQVAVPDGEGLLVKSNENQP